MTKPQPKEGTSSDGRRMHYSVGALVKNEEGKYLLIDRAVEPFGFAGPAGHVDEPDTSPEEAVMREVFEETGLTVRPDTLSRVREEEVPWNECSKGVDTHYWYLYECAAEGVLNRSVRETKSAGWFSPEEIENLVLEPVWRQWFEELGIIEEKPKITICGSMTHYKEMLSVRDMLEHNGCQVKIPRLALEVPEAYGGGREVYFGDYIDQNGGIDAFPPDHVLWDLKEDAILNHFSKIAWADAILIVNEEKHGLQGYVGGNTLIEIAHAFHLRKNIFILNDVSSKLSYKQEILGMKPVVINCDLQKVTELVA